MIGYDACVEMPSIYNGACTLLISIVVFSVVFYEQLSVSVMIVSKKNAMFVVSKSSIIYLYISSYNPQGISG